MKKANVNIVKDKVKITTLIFADNTLIEERNYDFNPDNVHVCLDCGGEFENSCNCGSDNSITYIEYIATGEF